MHRSACDRPAGLRSITRALVKHTTVKQSDEMAHIFERRPAVLLCAHVLLYLSDKQTDTGVYQRIKDQCLPFICLFIYSFVNLLWGTVATGDSLDKS